MYTQQQFALGDIGEEVIKNRLTNYNVTGPWREVEGEDLLWEEGWHSYDFRCDAKNGSHYFLCDCKMKSRRYVYRDFGVDNQHIQNYLSAHYRHKDLYGYKGFHIFFVDKDNGDIFRLNLATYQDYKLEKTQYGKWVAYFPIDTLIPMWKKEDVN